MKKVLIINGPNLNMLGVREPDIYGSRTLDDINRTIAQEASKLGVQTDFFQSNHEGDIVDKIHTVYTEYDGCVINAGAYTHYSYAILDAIKAVGKPFAEVHMSNIHAREGFRGNSVISPACVGQICGFGERGYILAIEGLIEKM